MPTTAVALRLAADAVEAGDRALHLCALLAGKAPISGCQQIRADLLMLAAWLDEHPDVDLQMFSVLEPAELSP